MEPDFMEPYWRRRNQQLEEIAAAELQRTLINAYGPQSEDDFRFLYAQNNTTSGQVQRQLTVESLNNRVIQENTDLRKRTKKLEKRLANLESLLETIEHEELLNAILYVKVAQDADQIEKDKDLELL